ncbi:MAG: helix-turn-helix domain-containing protein [Anaerolineae bacterium]|nr:helix-turn-helix domain-containing protein [Anaerolineae bacterium]
MSTSHVDVTEETLFLTPQEVSDLLQVSVQTVRRWINEEELPAYKVGPRMWRVSKMDLDAWLEQQRTTAAVEEEKEQPVDTNPVDQDM